MLHDEFIIENAKYIHGVYIYIYYPNHPKATKEGYIRKHILVAENKINRYLKDGECVHHIDFNKYNNSPDNLIIFKTNADHSRFHKTGFLVEVEPFIYISPMIEKICPVCGKVFVCKDSKNIFCSPLCSSISQRKSIRPTKDELYNLIYNNSFISVGRLFGVTDNTIREWCKSYGLPFRKKDIRNTIS